MTALREATEVSAASGWTEAATASSELATYLEQHPGDADDAMAFSELRKRASKLEATLKEKVPNTHSFKALQDYRHCLETAESNMAKVGCILAFIMCFADEITTIAKSSG